MIDRKKARENLRFLHSEGDLQKLWSGTYRFKRVRRINGVNYGLAVAISSLEIANNSLEQLTDFVQRFHRKFVADCRAKGIEYD